MIIDDRFARIGRPDPGRTPPRTPAAVSPAAGAGARGWSAALLRSAADLLDAAGDAVAALARRTAGTVDDPLGSPGH
jgi:hypothetical protein